MKTLAIILVSGTVGCAIGCAIGWLLCSICTVSQRADQCSACHLARTLRER